MPYKDRHGRTCGFVDYEEEENSGRFRRRYFMISPQDGCYYCYMDNPSNLPDGSTPVSDIKLSHISNARDATKQRPKVEFCFVVTTPDRSYYFQADNQADLEEWVKNLNGASRIMLKIPDKKFDGGSQVETTSHAENGGSKQDKHSTISYKTEIVGGVVVRTPVERDGHPSLPKSPLRCYPPTSAALTISTVNPSDSDSEDETSRRRKSWPRSPSPTPPLNRTLQPGFLHQHQALKTGWCVKQGGVRKNWKRRFFVLNDEGLGYFKSETDKISLRTISKKDITSCQVSDIPLSTQRDNLFEVTTGQRTFYVQAYSPEEMEEWVKAIRTLISGQRSSCPEQSTSYRGSSLQIKKPEGKQENKRDSKRIVEDARLRSRSNPLHSSGPSRTTRQVSQWYDEDEVKVVVETPQQDDVEEVRGHKNSKTMVTEL